MTDSELNKIIMEALSSGKVKTIHQRVIRAMHAVLRGEKWRDVEREYEVTQGGISRAYKRIGVDLKQLNR